MFVVELLTSKNSGTVVKEVIGFAQPHEPHLLGLFAERVAQLESIDD